MALNWNAPMTLEEEQLAPEAPVGATRVRQTFLVERINDQGEWRPVWRSASAAKAFDAAVAISKESTTA